MKNLYTRLVSNFVFPAHEGMKGHTSSRDLHEMEITQWWSRERLLEYQVERLRAFLGYVEQQVPYYSRLFAEQGFSPDTVSSTDDLKRLPFLTKAKIRENFEQLQARHACHLARFNTGGSSGEPLVFLIGRERVSRDVAAKWRATRWWGVDIGDPEVVVWGSPIELGTQDRIRRLRDRLFRTTLLPAFEMSEETLAHFVDVIRDKRPRMLFGYPSALELIASFAEENDERLDNLGIRVAFVTSERLYDHQRERIERVFGCNVANGYGGRDAGFVAHQCPAGGMHITAEDVVIEIVDTQGNVLPQNEEGEIVVTHLATRDFPFVRYRTGDIGVLDDRLCSCGRGLHMLKEIQGRTTDFIIAQDGTIMHGLALIYVIRDILGVKGFKIIQESLDRIRILLVVEPTFKDQAIHTIRSGVIARLGKGVQVTVKVVDEIPSEKSGKHRYIVSHVARG